MNIAIITGASSGLGREFARQLDTMCTDNIDEFWLIARRKDRLEDLAKQLEHECRILPYDITDTTDIAKLSHKFKSLEPTIRILINCAGFGLIGRFTELNIDKQLSMIDLNCKSLVKLTYMSLPYMKKNSRIINVASSAAYAPQPNFAIYAASKAFVDFFNRALAHELSNRKIYITSVCPGPVDTEFFDIAQTDGNMPQWKTMFIADAKDVVKKALRDSVYKKSVSIYGLTMNTWRIVNRFIPTELLMKIYK